MRYGIERVTPPTPEPVSRETRHWVCFPCRKMFQKHSATVSVNCPQCSLAMIDMGPKFEPPPMSKTKLWDRLERLAAKGYRFYCSLTKDLVFGRMRDHSTPSARTAILRIDALLERGPRSLLMYRACNVPRNRRPKLIDY